MSLLYWTMFVILSLIYLILIIAYLSLFNDEKQTGTDSLLPVSVLIASFIFVPAKELMSINTAVTIWKIMSVISFLLSLFIWVFSSKREKTSQLFGVVITFVLAIIPFVINISIEITNEKSIISYFDNNYSKFGITIIVFSGLVIIPMLFYLVRSFQNQKKIQQELYRLTSITNARELGDIASFQEPYNKLFRQELSSLTNKVDRQMSMVLQNLQNISSEVKNSKIKISKTSNQGMLKPESDILNIQKDIESIKQQLSLVDIYKLTDTSTDGIDNIDIIKELNHFLATPFSSIITDITIAKSTSNQSNASITTILDRINNSINLCKCIMDTYKDISFATFSGESTIKSLNEICRQAFDICMNNHDKENIKLELCLIPENIVGYSNHYLVSTIFPLLENAVYAAPDNSIIKITYNCDNHCIVLTNDCINIPTLKDLNTTGYSSKENHKGSGLMIVRHLLSAKNKGQLIITIEKNNVIQTIQLN